MSASLRTLSEAEEDQIDAAFALDGHETPRRRARTAAAEVRLKGLVTTLPKHLTNANAHLVAAAIEKLAAALARPRYRSSTSTDEAGTHAAFITEARLPDPDGTGALALIAAVAKVAALADAPVLKIGTIKTQRGTHRVSITARTSENGVVTKTGTIETPDGVHHLSMTEQPR